MDYWNKNLRLLEQKQPSLAKYITELKDPGDIVVARSRSGLPTLKTVNGKHQGKFLLSPKDPASEARFLLDNFPFNREDGTILFGFGLGYLAREISKKKDPNHVLYVVEGIPELFKLAMRYTNLSDVLSDDKTYFFVGEAIFKILDNFIPIQVKSITGTVNKLAIPSLRELCGQQYDEIDKKINNHVTFLQLSFTSFNHSKELRLANLFQNLPAMLNSSPANHLKNCVQNKPVIIAAAGPSLSQDIKALGNRPKDSIIICVDAALKPLLMNGIRPDLIVTCDPYPKNYNKVEGLSKELLHNIPLVYQGEATPQVIEQFSGHKFLVNAHNSLTEWLTNIGRRIVTFPFFPSVSHFGFMMARYMGADPIIFAGLDLSFPIDQEHADGCAQTWRLDFDNTEFIWVPNNDGGKVKTTPNFHSMIHSLEYEIKKTSARCINVSREGAMIEGAEWMPLKDVFKLAERKKLNGRNEKVNANTVELDNDVYYTNHLMPFKKVIERASVVKSDQLRDHYSNTLAWLISEVKSITPICREANTLLKSSKLHNGSEKEKQERLEKLGGLYLSALNHEDILMILTDYLPRYMILRSNDHKGRGAGDNIIHIIEDIELLTIFFEELIPSLNLLEKHCRQTFADLRK